MESNPENSLESSVIAQTKLWIEKAIIGLNLCPFAKSAHIKNQIHFAVFEGSEVGECVEAATQALQQLNAFDPAIRDTTLLMFPHENWRDFWSFLTLVESTRKRLKPLKLKGVIQIADFHPCYEFMDEAPDDISHFTNRSPYPTLHLIREDSIERAVNGDPLEAEKIYERNKLMLKKLGISGWNELWTSTKGEKDRRVRDD